MADPLFCMQCERPLDERQLSMKSLTVESCPFCGTMVRQSEGMRATNLDAIIMEDVAAIDTWVEDHARTTGLAVRKHPAEHGKYKWSVETKTTWVCEVAYSTDRTSILEFRLVSTENGEAIFEEPRKLQTICARYGGQPHGNRHTDGMKGRTVCEWGVVQYLSTSSLCEELFDPITARLSEGMNAVKQAFSSQS
jgi:hypothetical protein